MAITFPHKKRAGSVGGRGRKALLGLTGVALIAAGGLALRAQVEGDRGIAPLANSVDIQVGGIEVDVTGRNAAEARAAGWKEAEKLAWKQIGGPDMPVETIDSMVSSIVVEREQIGPRRYIARLGVVFDKTKAGQWVGAGEGGPALRSAPLLVIPVLVSGGVQQVFEVRGPWQKAWAEFQGSNTPIDYVRPTGAGGESLILTAGQPGRRSRNWWRNVLDQFRAADVVVPMARLERQWPGGPVKGTFTARYGPDNTFLGSFSMTAPNEDAVPQMLTQAVGRIDGLYRDALGRGLLRPDPTLNASRVELDRAFAQLRGHLLSGESHDSGPVEAAPPVATPSSAPSPVAEVASVSVQVATSDAAALDAALAALRGARGVRGASVGSLAVGGTSVLRVQVEGGSDALAAALKAQGWKVSGSGATLRISR